MSKPHEMQYTAKWANYLLRKEQKKIKKAIKYIEEKGRLKYNPDELLNILRGEIDEKNK